MTGFLVEDVILGHHKFQAAGPAPSWLWVTCAVWSVREGTDGLISLMAVRAYGTIGQARKLVEVELWEEAEGGFRFRRWRNGHPTPESDVEERRRKDRERKRNARLAVKGDTSHVRGHGQELDIPSSLEVPPLSPPQGGEPQPRKRAVPLPASWKPTDRHLEFAVANGLDLDAEVVKFRDHHLLKGTLGKDWDAGFRTWMRHAVEYRAAAAPAPKVSIRERYQDKLL